MAHKQTLKRSHTTLTTTTFTNSTTATVFSTQPPMDWFESPRDSSGSLNSTVGETVVLELSDDAHRALQACMARVKRLEDVNSSVQSCVLVVPVRFDGVPIETFDATSGAMVRTPPLGFTVDTINWQRKGSSRDAVVTAPGTLQLVVDRKLPLSSAVGHAPLCLAVMVGDEVTLSRPFHSLARQSKDNKQKVRKAKAVPALPADVSARLHTLYTKCGTVSVSSGAAVFARGPSACGGAAVATGDNNTSSNNHSGSSDAVVDAVVFTGGEEQCSPQAKRLRGTPLHHGHDVGVTAVGAGAGAGTVAGAGAALEAATPVIAAPAAVTGLAALVPREPAFPSLVALSAEGYVDMSWGIFRDLSPLAIGEDIHSEHLWDPHWNALLVSPPQSPLGQN